MELSRRDVVAALGAAGVAAGAGALGSGLLDGDPVEAHEVATLVAVAEVVYPSAVEGVESFVREYSLARVRDRPGHARGVADAVAALDDRGRDWFDGEFRHLDADARRTLLDQMCVDAADPDPAGDDRERVRYFVVNELLFALYTTPTGGRLAGIENPQGHPGGTDSYRRGPEP
jgi:hypothetical protein